MRSILCQPHLILPLSLCTGESDAASMPDEMCDWRGEFDEDGRGYLEGSADCHYYNPSNDLSDDDAGGIKRHEGEDWGDVYERWYEEALYSMVGTAAPHTYLASVSTHTPPIAPSLSAHAARLARARAAGQPPRLAVQRCRIVPVCPCRMV